MGMGMATATHAVGAAASAGMAIMASDWELSDVGADGGWAPGAATGRNESERGGGNVVGGDIVWGSYLLVF